MKTVLILLSILLCQISSVNAQEPIKFSTVINTDSVGKAALFSTINVWFASTYNSAQDVIQMNDPATGTIVGRGLIPYKTGKITYACFDGHISYTISVYVKENRYKIELTNFTQITKPGASPFCGLGLITNAELFAKPSMRTRPQNWVWVDIKVQAEKYSNDIFKSLEQKTLNIGKANGADDF
jgi:hypothetical protein